MIFLGPWVISTIGSDTYYDRLNLSDPNWAGAFVHNTATSGWIFTILGINNGKNFITPEKAIDACDEYLIARPLEYKILTEEQTNLL